LRGVRGGGCVRSTNAYPPLPPLKGEFDLGFC